MEFCKPGIPDQSGKVTCLNLYQHWTKSRIKNYLKYSLRFRKPCHYYKISVHLGFRNLYQLFKCIISTHHFSLIFTLSLRFQQNLFELS